MCYQYPQLGFFFLSYPGLIQWFEILFFCLLSLGEFNLSGFIIVKILFPASQFTAVASQKLQGESQLNERWNHS